VLRKPKVTEERINLIRERFAGRSSFTVAELEPLLDVKRTALYWTVWDLARKGYIHKVGKGLYSLPKENFYPLTPLPSLWGLEIRKAILEEGYDAFFISGLDVLSVFTQHVPDRFPVLIYADKYILDEITEILIKRDIMPVSYKDYDRIRLIEHITSVKGLAFVYPTSEFSYAENNMASIEKAFVDTYFEITRRRYPLDMEELAWIYFHMNLRNPVDTNRLVKIASRRGIQHDIRYIVDKDRVSDEAHQFVKLLEWSEDHG